MRRGLFLISGFFKSGTQIGTYGGPDPEVLRDDQLKDTTYVLTVGGKHISAVKGNQVHYTGLFNHQTPGVDNSGEPLFSDDEKKIYFTSFQESGVNAAWDSSGSISFTKDMIVGVQGPPVELFANYSPQYFTDIPEPTDPTDARDYLRGFSLTVPNIGCTLSPVLQHLKRQHAALDL